MFGIIKTFFFFSWNSKLNSSFLNINAIKKVPIVETLYVKIISWNSPDTNPILPFSYKTCPVGWEEIKLYCLKIPVRKAPTVPPTPCTANVSW